MQNQFLTSPLTNATKLLQSAIAVAREGSGQMAHEGHDDQSVLLDQGATMLEAAILLVTEGAARLGQFRHPSPPQEDVVNAARHAS